MAESKARRAIRLSIERRGGTVESMTWQPIGQMIEMQGREGGWTVFARMPDQSHEEVFTGYSWLDVLDHIDLSFPLGKRGES